MRVVLVLASVVFLGGCPGAILLGMASSDPVVGDLHSPNAKDYESWVGVTPAQIETHRYFSTLPREKRPVSDGSELWVLRHCPRNSKRIDDCCLHQFVITSAAVSQYRTTGPCGVSCEMRPETKVQACINAAKVPDGYR